MVIGLKTIVTDRCHEWLVCICSDGKRTTDTSRSGFLVHRFFFLNAESQVIQMVSSISH